MHGWGRPVICGLLGNEPGSSLTSKPLNWHDLCVPCTGHHPFSFLLLLFWDFGDRWAHAHRLSLACDLSVGVGGGAVLQEIPAAWIGGAVHAICREKRGGLPAPLASLITEADRSDHRTPSVSLSSRQIGLRSPPSASMSDRWGIAMSENPLLSITIGICPTRLPAAVLLGFVVVMTHYAIRTDRHVCGGWCARCRAYNARRDVIGQDRAGHFWLGGIGADLEAALAQSRRSGPEMFCNYAGTLQTIPATLHHPNGGWQ